METTFRFGTTTGPCNIVTERREEELEDYDTQKNIDPDKILQCPYDKNHQIRASRFPYHLIKCKKNHPKLAEELKTCPFNARHLIAKHEFAHHLATCEDRIIMDSRDGETKNGHCSWHVPVVNHHNQDANEDWDQEADDHVTPFVWGANPMLNQSTANNLGPSFRAPNSLPWTTYNH